MFNALDFVVVALAAGAVIDVWHKGSIFSTARAYAQAIQDVTPHDSAKGKLLELINCPFCKSYHLPFYLFIMLLAGNWVGGSIMTVTQLALYSLAATRLGNIVDNLLPGAARYMPQEGPYNGTGYDPGYYDSGKPDDPANPPVV